jgi:hypothetical protein
MWRGAVDRREGDLWPWPVVIPKAGWQVRAVLAPARALKLRQNLRSAAVGFLVSMARVGSRSWAAL